MKRWPKLLAGLLAAVLGLTITSWLVLLRPVAQPPTNDPIENFSHGSIGNEEAQGLPYWIWRVLPQVFPEYLPGQRKDGYRAVGVYWRAGDELPVGFSKKTLGMIPRVSLNCAFCHQGSYRLSPDEPSVYVPGGPGTRVNPQGYLRFLAAAGRDARFNSGVLMAEITKIYDMPLWERTLYRFLLIPATKSALEEQGKRFEWTTSRPDWGPGRIDPFNPVKFQNLELGDDATIGNSDMMPLWGLNYEQEEKDPSRKYSLHWDGLNRSLREVVISGAIGDGMTYKTWPQVRDNLVAMEDFMRLQQPPPSPLRVDAALAEDGKKIFDATCASCHARKIPGPEGLPNPRFRTVIPQIEVGTDRHRLDMWSEPARERYTAYQSDYPWELKAFVNEDGYVATELNGLWLRGPYLHNGSVPTLADLLKPAKERPAKFYRGCDLVDAEKGGFACTADDGWLYDTAEKGNSNAGHEMSNDLSGAQKDALLAYLKTL